MSAPSPELAAFLVDAAFSGHGEDSEWTPLSGGVSSDIWRVTTSRGTICVKRALPKLRVAADWTAPVSRNAYEWEYTRLAGAIAPEALPRLFAHDPKQGLFAMEWLPPETHPVWKGELMAGRVDIEAAARVGDLVGRIHAATAHDPALPAQFATDDSFHALRIEPYLLATAHAHPDLATRIEAIAARTAATKRALVHGDVSPKNILLGPSGPVLLDAECAWFGDPAFDLAFCLCHLAIKRRIASDGGALAASYEALAQAYLTHVDWKPRTDLEARAADLVPALALARADGKSPVEYLDAHQRTGLRNAARRALQQEPTKLAVSQALLTS